MDAFPIHIATRKPKRPAAKRCLRKPRTPDNELIDAASTIAEKRHA
jgi:hypothetical protein